jgi:oxygen-independent coproporphyrinogen-3 oxidase
MKFHLPPWIYLHYPICRHHCSYCDFNVVSAQKSPAHFEELWVQTISRHLEHWAREPGATESLRSLYLGGGTPSLLSAKSIQKIIMLFDPLYVRGEDFEFTIECNPENLSAEYLRELRGLGVNRVSLGIQTTLPGQLRRLERLATHKNIFDAIENTAMHFKNFSLDLMIGIPDQTLETLETDLAYIKTVQPPHVSVYLLTIDSQHKWNVAPSTKHRLATPELAAQYYERVCEMLRNEGYIHYEVSNFAKPGFESRHNQNYWDAESHYLGMGPGAHGYLKTESGERVRYECERDLVAWAKSSDGIAEQETLSLEQMRLERLYLMLRSGKVIDAKDVDRQKLAKFIQDGLAIQSGAGISLTERGWLLMEAVSAELII